MEKGRRQPEVVVCVNVADKNAAQACQHRINTSQTRQLRVTVNKYAGGLWGLRQGGGNSNRLGVGEMQVGKQGSRIGMCSTATQQLSKCPFATV